jgi:hypothetical protein
MSYGYNSSLAGNHRTESRLLDYLRHFMAQLENARDSVHVCEKPSMNSIMVYVLILLYKKFRPIIFVGHSLGGILILQVSSGMVRKNLFPG